MGFIEHVKGLKFNYWYDYLILVIIMIKTIFLILAITEFGFKLTKKTDTEASKNVIFWKERTEFIFIILMAVLLIYLFNPRDKTNKTPIITDLVKLLLFLYGFIIIITANWTIFIQESVILEGIRKIFHIT